MIVGIWIAYNGWRAGQVPDPYSPESTTFEDHALVDAVDVSFIIYEVSIPGVGLNPPGTAAGIGILIFVFSLAWFLRTTGGYSVSAPTTD